MLIFSKIQSNLWPNIEKIGLLFHQIRDEIDRGGDIKKFSLEYRLENENEDQYFVDTYKKVIKFKINKRPHSSQYNSSAYYSRGSGEPIADIKANPLPRRNVVSLKKNQYKFIYTDEAIWSIDRFLNSNKEKPISQATHQTSLTSSRKVVTTSTIITLKIVITRNLKVMLSSPQDKEKFYSRNSFLGL